MLQEDKSCIYHNNQERGCRCRGNKNRQERLEWRQKDIFKNSQSLSEIEKGKRVRIMLNPDKQTVGMGLFSGQILKVIKNEKNDTKLIIGVIDSRFIVPREIAKEIIVK